MEMAYPLPDPLIYLAIPQGALSLSFSPMLYALRTPFSISITYCQVSNDRHTAKNAGEEKLLLAVADLTYLWHPARGQPTVTFLSLNWQLASS